MEQAAEQRIAKRRNWRQFTLRTLLLVTLLASLPLAWIANELAMQRQERELAAAILEAGGYVNFSGDSSDEVAWMRRDRIEGITLKGDAPDKFRPLLARVKRLKYVRALDLSDSCLSDPDLVGIENLHRLTDLDLTGTSVGDEGIEHLSRLSKLQHLTLDLTDASDSALQKLAGLQSLEVLKVSGTHISSRGIASLTALRPEVYVICSGHLEADEISAARGLRRQRWGVYFREADEPIRVSAPERNEEIKEGELICLNRLRTLHLDIQESYPRDIYQVLPKVHGLRSLYSAGGVDVAALRCLAKCRDLHTLSLSTHPLVDDDLAVFKEFSQLEALYIDFQSLSARGIEHIANLDHLTTLWLERGTFSEESLASLVKIKGLSELWLTQSQFATGSTVPLGKLKLLTHLNLYGAKLQDDDFAPLLELEVLEELDVRETQITDRGLIQLAKIKSLKELNVFSLSNRLTDDGEKRFHDLRPDVKLEKHAPGSPRYVRGAGVFGGRDGT